MKKFITFWKDLFLNPQDFFSKNLRNSDYEPAYFTLAIILFGIGHGIDRLDKNFTKYDLRGELETIAFLNNWVIYWTVAAIVGVIGGYIGYLLGGWFFNVRLKWSEGTDDIDKSRYIYLYSDLVLSIIIIGTTMIAMTFYDRPYEPESDLHLWDLISLILVIFFSYYSVYVSYTGVRTITKANELKSKIWFLMLPMIIYTLAYFTIFIFFYNYFI